jgi:hypothetical protein
MVLDENEGLEYSLRSVNKASLKFNFHDQGEKNSINVDIVVENCLLEHINNIIERDELINTKLSERRAQLSGHIYEET